jgi:hypothetical protein
LIKVVENLIANTTNDILVNVYDQHQFDREDSFDKFHNVIYNQVFWDHQDSPTQYKALTISQSEADFFLIISDDILVKPGWDSELINFIKDQTVIVSGAGIVKLVQNDIFSFRKEFYEIDEYTVTNVIDRNFIFGKLSSIKSISYPQNIKYFGEEEMVSVLLSCSGHKIYSSPTGFYEDLKLRTVENLYVPFSKEHGYNTFISAIKDHSVGDVSSWLEYHGIDPSKIKPLPYQTDDVAYDPSNMIIDVDDIGGKRFTNNLKAIF